VAALIYNQCEWSAHILIVRLQVRNRIRIKVRQNTLGVQYPCGFPSPSKGLVTRIYGAYKHSRYVHLHVA